MEREYWWGCSESYRNSGRLIRIWAEQTDGADVRPDDENTNGYVPYPFNGIGARVECGPFDTEKAALEALGGMILQDSDGDESVGGEE